MLPFTLILLGSVALAGFWTKIHRGDLPNSWMEKIGFAPNDLWSGRLERVLFSTFFTDSRKSFIQALGMTLVLVGLSERTAGTWRTVLTFWGVHTLTLIILSLFIVLPLHRLKISFGAELALVRDVGPSAGYFGCLGFLVSLIPLPWQWWAGALIFTGLTAAFLMPPRAGENTLVKKHADLAHMIGLVLGVLSGWVWR